MEKQIKAKRRGYWCAKIFIWIYSSNHISWKFVRFIQVIFSK